MTECSVPRCGQEIPRDRFVCSDCVRVLRQDLVSVPALVDDLLTTISRQDVLGASGGRRAAETALSWKEHASEALWDLNNTITTWTRDVLELRGLSSEIVDRSVDMQPTHHRVTISAARWLLANVESLAMQPDVGEAVDEIGAAVQRAYRAIDRPAEKLLAGQCLANDCPAYLYADPNAETVECPKCGAEHDMAERHAWMSAQAVEYRLPAAEAYGWVKMLLGKQLPESTWRRWLTQPVIGDDPRLPHDDLDHVGRKLYRWGDVADLVRAWVAQPKQSKKGAAA